MPQQITVSHHLPVATTLADPLVGDMPGASAGVPYSFQLPASGGIPPYQFNSVTGLPSGLTCSSGYGGGLITGIPGTNGNPLVTYTIKDSSP